MILLNTKIWAATVEEAKSKAANSPAWLRAIEKADVQMRRARYWAFDAETNTLRLMSARTKEIYIITADSHTCPATESGHKVCYHRAAHRLCVRYVANLGNVAAIEATVERVQNWNAKEGHTIRETPRVVITPHPMNTKEQRRAYWAKIAALPHADLDKRLPKRAA